MCALHACGVWNLADMKTLGTLHSNYTHVVACLRKGVSGSMCYRFCYRFHALCKLENHVARQCCSTRLQRTKPFHLCPSIYHVSHVKGFAQESSGLSFFCFLIVLEGIEHAFRKTDMRILISYMGGFYTLSLVSGRLARAVHSPSCKQVCTV